MNTLITYFTVGTAMYAIVYAVDGSMFYSFLACAIAIALTFFGFRIDAFIEANGNDLLNKIIYYFTRSYKNYNILHKHVTYTYLGNKEYSFKKEYELEPLTDELDRFDDRFDWSAPSDKCVITPTESDHQITNVWLEESWTRYTVYFGGTAKKGESYKVGSVISDLIDSNDSAVPFLTNTIDKKTKKTTLEVVFPQNDHPDTVKYAIFSNNSGMEAIHEETLEYDISVRGFKKTIYFPRKGWRYVISWEK